MHTPGSSENSVEDGRDRKDGGFGTGDSLNLGENEGKVDVDAVVT